MGKYIVEKWQCDRCGAIKDVRPCGSGRTHYEVVVAEDHEVAGGVTIRWKEMCGQCDTEVGAELDAMKRAADAAKKRQAVEAS